MHKGCWLRGRRFSVSKLAIGLSDYTVLLWAAIVAWDLTRLFAPACVLPWLKQMGVLTFVVLSGVFVVLLFVYGRSSPRSSRSSP